MKKMYLLIALLVLFVGLNHNVTFAGDCELDQVLPETPMSSIPGNSQRGINVWVYTNKYCPMSVHYREGWFIQGEDVVQPSNSPVKGTRFAFMQRIIQLDWNNPDVSANQSGLLKKIANGVWKYEGELRLAVSHQPGFKISNAEGKVLDKSDDMFEKYFIIERLPSGY